MSAGTTRALLDLVLVASIAVHPAGAGVVAADVSRPVTQATIEAVVRAVADTALTPGISVAVIQPGGKIWTLGIGFADLDRRRPVGSATRFYIASTTKALTALAALRLAQRGELDLDAPLSRALPTARFANGLSGDSIRVRDLLTHTHGIDPRTPISLRIAFTGDYDNRQLIELLSHCHPAPQGHAFRYSNLGYDLVGLLLAPRRTRGWREVVAREVIEPAGMSHTTAYRSRLASADIAWPYEMGPAGWERIALAKQNANMGPAGGYFSTAADLARLVAIELDHGRLNGSPIFPAELIDESQRLQAVQDRDFGPFHRFGWGVGWDLGTFEGDTVLHRPGSFAGYFSNISFMPRHGVGVVVLVNGGDAAVAVGHAVTASVYDHLLGRSDAEERLRKRIEDLHARLAEGHDALVADRAKRAGRQKPLPLPLAAYRGRYSNSLFGTLELALRGGALWARMGVAESPVEVFDAEKNQLRVELFGGGDVLEAVVPRGASRPRAMRMREADFTRR